MAKPLSGCVQYSNSDANKKLPPIGKAVGVIRYFFVKGERV